MRGNIPYEPSSRRRLSAWLQEKLLERRIVLVTGWLDAGLAAEASAALMTLDAIGDEPIELHLDSPDGTLESAFVLIDTLDLLHATLRAHCRGQVGGPGHRCRGGHGPPLGSPHTRFRLFQPTAQFSGTPDQIASHSRQQQELLWRLHARLAQLTGPCRGDRRGHATRALPRRQGSARLRAPRRDQHHPMSRDDARLEDTAAGLDAQGGQLSPSPAAKDSFAAPRTRPGDREKEDDGLSLGRGSDRPLAG